MNFLTGWGKDFLPRHFLLLKLTISSLQDEVKNHSHVLMKNEHIFYWQNEAISNSQIHSTFGMSVVCGNIAVFNCFYQQCPYIKDIIECFENMRISFSPMFSLFQFLHCEWGVEHLFKLLWQVVCFARF